MFLHTFHPQPILIKAGPIKIYWYGLFIAVGILAAYLTSKWLLEKYKSKFDSGERFLRIIDLPDLAIYLAAGGFIGARLFYVISEWRYFLLRPADTFKVWNGGLWIYGTIFGGFIGLFIYAKKYAVSMKNIFAKFILDLLAPGMIFAQAIGRWGNYFNQELYGLPTKLAWGIPVDIINRTNGYQMFEYFHPVFLYESLWCIAVGMFLLGMHFYKLRKTPAGAEFNNIASGRIFFAYLFLYSFGRVAFEFLRVDSVPLLFGVRITQITAGLVMVMAGMAIIFPLLQKGEGGFFCK